MFIVVVDVYIQVRRTMPNRFRSVVFYIYRIQAVIPYHVIPCIPLSMRLVCVTSVYQ